MNENENKIPRESEFEKKEEFDSTAFPRQRQKMCVETVMSDQVKWTRDIVNKNIMKSQ